VHKPRLITADSWLKHLLTWAVAEMADVAADDDDAAAAWLGHDDDVSSDTLRAGRPNVVTMYFVDYNTTRCGDDRRNE